MNWLLGYILFSSSLMFGCYLVASVIQARYPAWWQRHICDRDPEDRGQSILDVKQTNYEGYKDEKICCFVECFADPQPGENTFIRN